jgi:hypothetical protein
VARGASRDCARVTGATLCVCDKGCIVKEVEEYRRHARECAELAEIVSSPDNRKMLLNMAYAWDVLARRREEQLAHESKRAD